MEKVRRLRGGRDDRGPGDGSVAEAVPGLRLSERPPVDRTRIERQAQLGSEKAEEAVRLKRLSEAEMLKRIVKLLEKREARKRERK